MQKKLMEIVNVDFEATGQLLVIHTQRKLLGIVNVDFEATGQLLVIYSAFVK